MTVLTDENIMDFGQNCGTQLKKMCIFHVQYIIQTVQLCFLDAQNALDTTSWLPHISCFLQSPHIFTTCTCTYGLGELKSVQSLEDYINGIIKKYVLSLVCSFSFLFHVNISKNYFNHRWIEHTTVFCDEMTISSNH